MDNEFDITLCVVDGVSVYGHQASDGEIEDRTQDTAVDEKVSTARLLDEDEGDTGRD